jgi:ribokinase
MGKVIVVGSINIDLVVTADRFPRSGETLIGNSFTRHPGGKGANQAVASARMEAKTIMIGAVGADPSGEFMRRTLSQAGIDTGLVRSVPDAPTGTAVIMVAGGENSIVVIAGANAKLTVEDGSLPIARDDVVVAQLEVPSAAWSAAFKAASAVGATTILNAAPASTEIADFLPLCDVVVVNEIELGSLSGRSVSDAGNASSLLAAMHSVRRTSHQVIIATRGRSGLVCLGPDGVIEMAGHNVPVIDSTGAGDCFVGAFAAVFVVDRDLKRALLLANAAAAISVQRAGAGSSMPMRAEVIEQFGL